MEVSTTTLDRATLTKPTNTEFTPRTETLGSLFNEI